MTIIELINNFNAFDSGETAHTFIRDAYMIHYENEYMKCVRVDSSNRHVSNNRMLKQWSILFENKKDFGNLPNYQKLRANMDVKITLVTRGELKGCWGLRIYNVHKEPNYKMVKMILDFIFS